MIFVKTNIFYIILFNNFANSLVELPKETDNSIVISERIIRETVRNLLAMLNIKDVSDNPRLKTLSTIHNFFVSITLKDYVILKDIANLVQVKVLDKYIQAIVMLINEILNEEEHSSGKTNDILVDKNIKIFIAKIKDLKNTVDHTGNWKIDTDILKLIDKNEFLLKDNKSITEIARPKHNTNSTRNYKFWQPNARRIYRGRRVNIRNFPFMASVQFFNRFQCGGSIIKSDLVITSSSCLQLAWNNRFFRENPAFLSVRVGSDFSERQGENIPVLEVYFHPDYNPKTLKHNLAIMRLTKRIHFSKKVPEVKKIDFDRAPVRLPDTTNGIVVLGWGARDSRNYVRSRRKYKLLYDKLNFYPLRECRHRYSKAFVTRRHFCAGYFSKGGGACNRDAGGPGIVNDTLMGVISFGSLTCGAVNAPTVFTKLGYYTDWIEEIMEKKPPRTLKKFEPTAPPPKRFSRRTRATPFKFTPVVETTLETLKNDDYLRKLKQINDFKELLAENAEETEEELLTE